MYSVYVYVYICALHCIDHQPIHILDNQGGFTVQYSKDYC